MAETQPTDEDLHVLRDVAQHGFSDQRAAARRLLRRLEQAEAREVALRALADELMDAGLHTLQHVIGARIDLLLSEGRPAGG